MDGKRYVTGSIVVLIFLFIFEMLYRGIALKGVYEDAAVLLRSDIDFGNLVFWAILGYVILAFGFCYIFVKGYEGGGLGEGFRFGLVAGITFGTATTLIGYAIYAIPTSLAVAWGIGYPVEMTIAGLIIAAIYRRRSF